MGGNIEKGSILNEAEVIGKAKEARGLLVREIEKRKKQLIVYRAWSIS